MEQYPHVRGGEVNFECYHGCTFPEGSVPAQFTILCRARYTGTQNRGRILNGTSKNWLLGWWNGRSGVHHYKSEHLVVVILFT